MNHNIRLALNCRLSILYIDILNCKLSLSLDFHISGTFVSLVTLITIHNHSQLAKGKIDILFRIPGTSQRSYKACDSLSSIHSLTD